nr:zinc finger protein 26-like [Maniola hyperantus]
MCIKKKPAKTQQDFHNPAHRCLATPSQRHPAARSLSLATRWLSVSTSVEGLPTEYMSADETAERKKTNFEQFENCNKENKMNAKEDNTVHNSKQAFDINSAGVDDLSHEMNCNRIVELNYNMKRVNKSVTKQKESLLKTQEPTDSYNIPNITSKYFSCEGTSQNNVTVKGNTTPCTNEENVPDPLLSKTATACPKAAVQRAIEKKRRRTACPNNDSNISWLPEKSSLVEENFFTRERHLVKHNSTHTEVTLFTCKFCPYKTEIKQRMKMHMTTHTGYKPFRCKFCTHTCARKSYLVIHMKRHTDEKPISCSLYRHMRSHTGEKPYQCGLCECRYAQKGHLKRHMMSHTGDRPYSCEFCEYKAVRNSHLKRHMRTHTGEKPFSCELCDYKCAERVNLSSI